MVYEQSHPGFVFLVAQPLFISSSSFVQWEKSGKSQSRKCRTFISRRCNVPVHLKRRLPRMCLGIPEDIRRELNKFDKMELRRRALISMNPPSELSEEAERGLLSIPEIAELEEAWQPESGKLKFDPDDYRVFSWAYKRLRPWQLGSFSVALVVILAYASMRQGYIYLTSKYSTEAILGVWSRIDSLSTLSLASLLPVLLFPISLALKEQNGDAPVRMMAMFLISASLLFSVAILASTGAARSALIAGSLIRASALPMSLWFWKDISGDIEASRSVLAYVLRCWRVLTTVFVVIGGSLLRILVLLQCDIQAMYTLVSSKTSLIRRTLGARFPVALSLLRDPGGLHFFVFLSFFAAGLYGVYLYLFLTDFLRVRSHRKTNSLLSSLLEKYGILNRSSLHQRRARISSAPPGVASYFSSDVMLIKRVEGLLGTDSLLISEENSLPILELLENEERVMRARNMPRWMPERTEFVAPGPKLSEGALSTQALLTWARPLSKSEKAKSYAEFFDTLEEDEYDYNPDLDLWTFSDAVKSADEHGLDAEGKRSEPFNGQESPVPLKQSLPVGDDEDNADTIFV